MQNTTVLEYHIHNTLIVISLNSTSSIAASSLTLSIQTNIIFDVFDVLYVFGVQTVVESEVHPLRALIHFIYELQFTMHY